MNKRRAKTYFTQLNYAPSCFGDLIGVTLAGEHAISKVVVFVLVMEIMSRKALATST